MKLAKIISVAALILGLSSCNLDFKNSCDDKWLIVNYSRNSISNITFSDSTTTESVEAATTEDSKIKPSTKSVSHKADATVTLADSYHVDTESSYSYSETPTIRKLIIRDQPSYVFSITSSSDRTVDFILNKKTYPNDITGGSSTDKEDEIKYTKTFTSTAQTITIYKNSPTFTFYTSGTKNILAYTSTTDTSGKTYIEIK